METRSSPSLEHLQKLIETVESPTLQERSKHLSKPELFTLLQSSMDIPRAERRLRSMVQATQYGTASTSQPLVGSPKSLRHTFENCDHTKGVASRRPKSKRLKHGSENIDMNDTFHGKGKAKNDTDCVAGSSSGESNNPLTSKNTKQEVANDKQVLAVNSSHRALHPSAPEWKENSTLKLSRAKSKSRVKRKTKSVISPQSTFDETMDPIMRTKLGKHVFCFQRPNGKVVRYDADTLVDYLLATGDFCEPESRISFNDDDLVRLDTYIKQQGLEKESVVQAKENRSKYADREFRRDALLGLERCAGQLVCRMLEVIEDVVSESLPTDEAEAQLLLEIFPFFMHHFDSILCTDAFFAKQCISQYKTFIRGPPNRPTSNHLGTRDVVLRFLDQVSSGECSSKDFGV